MSLVNYFDADFDSSKEAYIEKDLRGFVTSWSSGATKVFGFDSNEMLGESILKLFPEERLAEEAVIMNQIRQGLRVDHFEAIRLHKDGRPIQASVTISPIYDTQGQVIGAKTAARDIGDQYKIDELRDRIASIVNSSEDAIIAVTLAGTSTNWNQSATRIFGWTSNEIIGQSVEILIPKDRLNEERKNLECIRIGQRFHHFKTQNIHKSGKLVWVSVATSAVYDKNQKVIGASKIFRDITQQVEFEE